MKIYFSANQDANELNKRFQKIVDILTKAGNTVMTNLDLENAAKFSQNDVEKFTNQGQTLLEQMDALVIDATKRSAENGYLVALALTHKKPILFIYEKGKDVDKNLLTLQKEKDASKLLDIQSYAETKLSSILLEFLDFAEKKGGIQLPKIKFTLRITPKIERYLHWKTHNTKFSKADFLRKKIEDMIESDDEFKKYN